MCQKLQMLFISFLLALYHFYENFCEFLLDGFCKPPLHHLKHDPYHYFFLVPIKLKLSLQKVI